MYSQKSNRKRLYGPAGAALLATVGLVGGSFALATSASADTTSSTTTTTVASSTTSTTSTSTTTTSVPPTTTSVPVTTIPTNQSVAQIQAEGNRAIDRRVASLNHTIKVVEGDSYMGSDQAALVTKLQADISGLTALKSKLDADTTVATAYADYRSIFPTYRVYYFALPDASLIISADHDNNVVIPADQTQINTLMGELNGTSNPTAKDRQAAKLVADAQKRVDMATTATKGLSAELLSYTAADWDANHKILNSPTAAVAAARWDLLLANRDLSLAQRDVTNSRSGVR